MFGPLGLGKLKDQGLSSEIFRNRLSLRNGVPYHHIRDAVAKHVTVAMVLEAQMKIKASAGLWGMWVVLLFKTIQSFFTFLTFSFPFFLRFMILFVFFFYITCFSSHFSL